MTYYASIYGAAPMKIDYETGSLSQWPLGGGGNGIADVDSYPSIVSADMTFQSSWTSGGQTIIPDAGAGSVGFAKLVVPPPIAGQSQNRAEGVRWVNWSAYDGKELWITHAVCLEPGFNWNSNWTASATNDHFSPVIAQPMGSFFRTICLWNLRPIGWQGITAPALTVFACGGACTGTSEEHRLALNPAAGNGWDTLLSPTAAANTGARFVQLIGPNTMLAGNRPFTPGVWHLIKFHVTKMNTDGTPSLGGYEAWHRVAKSGLGWVKVVGSTNVYKTMGYYAAGGYAAHGAWNYTTNVGCYSYSLPQTITVGEDCYGESDSETDADAIFSAVGGGGGGGPLQPPAVGGGKTRGGYTPVTDVVSTLSANAVRLERFNPFPTQPGQQITLDKAYAKLQGAASGGASTHKFVIYNDASGLPGSLVSTASEVSVAQGAALAWVDVSPSSPVVADCPCWIGLHTGGAAGSWGMEVSNPGYRFGADTYSDGPANPAASTSATSPATELGLVIDYSTVVNLTRIPGGRSGGTRVAQDATHLHVVGTGGGL